MKNTVERVDDKAKEISQKTENKIRHEIQEFQYSIKQGLASLFCKEEDSKQLRLCRPYGLCCNYSILPL
jgi:DNA-binding LacI/PurR family transcriptional regulator